MNFIRGAINQPVTVAVCVVLVIMAGVLAMGRIPIQLTPTVEDMIIAVTTRWEGASPDEIEREIVDRQEEKLQGVANLIVMTSESQQGQGVIRLQFSVGTNKESALREVSDKLREVSDYPDNVDEPIVEASDPENRDYIAWILLENFDTDFDVRTLQDMAEDRIKPVLERVNGISEINVIGGREREAQIRYDPIRLAHHGVTGQMLATAIRETNRNVSAGQVEDSKSNIRVRTIGQYESVEDVKRTVVRQTDAGPVFVGDVADVVETYKEAFTFVHSRGEPVIAINAQREIGTNVMAVMNDLRAAIDRLNDPGGVLETQANAYGLKTGLRLRMVYDQTIYIDDALALVRNNIWLGGALAVIVLLLFLRSIQSVAIIALAIPISIVGAVVVMVALGRSLNVVSLAGMAFATGLVVDNAIVVLENIFRHLEMGKKPMRAAFEGTSEVWGAVLAATLTTVFVFIPILLIQEEAGQLFRDIALAICAAVTLSLIVSVTVIPVAAARLLRERNGQRRKSRMARAIGVVTSPFGKVTDLIAGLVYLMCGSIVARVLVVAILTTVSIYGSYKLMPPADYLPRGNRNLVFGLLIPPPGYNLQKQQELARRIETTMRPYWEVGKLEKDSPEYLAAQAKLPSIPTFDWATQGPGDPVTPPPLENYFLVSFDGIMFHGGISEDPQRVVDVAELMTHATRSEIAPGVLAFAFQVSLFRTGGSSGMALKIDLVGDEIAEVTDAASAAFGALGRKYGYQSVQPSPSNFNIFGPEIRVKPNLRRLADVGLSLTDLALAVQSAGDGAIIGEYRLGSDTIDLKLIAANAVDRRVLGNIEDFPVATPSGAVVPISSLADLHRVTSPPQINHTGRQRSITLQFTPPPGKPLAEAIAEVESLVEGLRVSGAVTPGVGMTLSGSASKLESVRTALLGNGTILGTLGSSLVLALAVVYLLMCVLFQSFSRPLVIMFTVPLATLGGFAALFVVFIMSAMDRYVPMQTLDVLTMLGFVILIGIVVNNAILIVHQAQNFMLGKSDVDDLTNFEHGKALEPRRAIAEAVRSRVRPIFMGTLTSIGGMAPLVIRPGSGSELYRGLGAVVLGGLLVSTVFTLLLVPLLLSLLIDFQIWFGRVIGRKPRAQARLVGKAGSADAAATSNGHVQAKSAAVETDPSV